MSGMSSPMSLKGDPDMHLKKVLKKYHRDDAFDDVQSWLDLEPDSPLALKVHWILTFADGTVDDRGNATKKYWDIDPKDPMTWSGDVPDMPPDQFFLDLFKAIKADEKRQAKRSSYEF